MQHGNPWRLSISLTLLLLATACAKKNPQPPEPDAERSADTVYFGGSILTMAGDQPQYVEALAVRNGKIIWLGSKADVTSRQSATTRQVDLQGRTLLPGFIDAHGHVLNAGFQRLSAKLLPPPDGDGKDIASLIELLKQWQNKSVPALQQSGWIVGFGYDDSQLAEQRHPTATELDRVSKETPVVIMHQSGHLGVINHRGLTALGFNANSKDPPGGVIRREQDGRTPNGVLEESAFFAALGKVLGGLDTQANETMALEGIAAYTQFGFTTAQEGRASKGSTETWRTLAGANKLQIDVAVYPDLQVESEYMKQVGTRPTYDHHFRIAGVKLSFDGSPQGRTAWLTQPYFAPPPGQPKSYRGYPAIANAKEREALVDLAFQNHWQLIVHTNGDAAADALIDAVAKAESRYGKDDRRTVMIHAQTVREDQLDRMAQLAIIPSFFSMHTYYWGDWHRDVTLGKERAYRISPTGSALERGMLFTEHHDAPVALPSAIMILHTTVNRTSRSGDVIGADQRVSAYVALKSITEWAAYQYFEEHSKGTLAVGKLADFVVLDRDPLHVEPATLKDLKVMQTIKEDRVVYSAP